MTQVAQSFEEEKRQALEQAARHIMRRNAKS